MIPTFMSHTCWQLAAGDPSLRLKNGCGQDDAVVD